MVSHKHRRLMWWVCCVDIVGGGDILIRSAVHAIHAKNVPCFSRLLTSMFVVVVMVLLVDVAGVRC